MGNQRPISSELIGYDGGMAENRTAKISVMLTPAELAALTAYAQEHRWSRSTAVAALIDEALLSGPARGQQDEEARDGVR
jgi:hypothetical protein